MVLLGGIFLSSSGVLIRHVETASGWQILFYRSITYFITIGTILLFQYRADTASKFKSIGWSGIAASCLLAVGSVFYILALLKTTVANVVFIIGASPLITALVGWVFLRERVTAFSFAAMLMAVMGIGLMFADGYVTGGMTGNLFALMMVFTYVGFLLLLRRKKDVDMLPATCLSGLIAAGIALIFVEQLSINLHDLQIALVLGAAQFGLGFMFLTWGTRRIPAAEVALFSLSESVLNPVWTWLFANEVPSTYTLLGSAIVLIAVFSYGLAAVVRERTASTAAHST